MPVGVIKYLDKINVKGERAYSSYNSGLSLQRHQGRNWDQQSRAERKMNVFMPTCG